ncbi:UxaA family hydrolase [Microbaculum sp. FT89]|uniref:UxaA family hydrolase n=1 Tax=Microbaculum sp. FT89 TaxID=3447298 RepID=UPI003F52F98B
MEFLGYERPDGQVGLRNQVGIVSVMDNCNPVTRAICRSVNGTLPITTLFVRGQLGRDLEIAYDTLAGLARNPNIAAVVVVGLEPVTTEEVASRIRSCGKPVEVVDIQLVGGTIEATANGTRRAARLVREVTRQRRVPYPISKLTVGVECGGSDTTSGLASNPSIGVVADRIVEAGGRVVISETSEFFGAEELFAGRAADEKVAQDFLDAVLSFEREVMSRGLDLRGANPSKDNIRGGLTTIEEKALGAMAKAGSTPLVGVLRYGEAPQKPGLHFMATPAPAVESLTGLAAGGCQMILFSTGVGNPIGSTVATTVKVSGNRNTVDTFSDNIDFDVSAVIENAEPLGDAGARLLNYAIEVASGALTSSEVLDIRETAISRFEPSM